MVPAQSRAWSARWLEPFVILGPQISALFDRLLTPSVTILELEFLCHQFEQDKLTHSGEFSMLPLQ